MFCAQCGTKNDELSNFCMKCGIALRKTAAQEGKLLSVPRIYVRRALGELGRVFCNIIITDKRIVGAKTGSTWVRDKKLIGGLITATARASQDESKYADPSPEQILQADSANFAFAYDDLQGIELKKGLLGGPAHMVIKNKKGKKEIWFDSKYLPEIEQVLARTATRILKGP